MCIRDRNNAHIELTVFKFTLNYLNLKIVQMDMMNSEKCTGG